MPEGMTPEERAELIRRVAVLSEKLDVSEKQQAETDRIAKESHEAAEESARTANRQKWYTRALLLLLVVVAFFVNEQRQDGQDVAAQADRLDRAIADIQTSRIQQCENGNATRAGQRRAWTELLTVSDASAAAQGIAPDNPVRAYYAAYIDWITDEVFPDRDCTDLDKVYDDPAPAPSFREALEESIRQQGEGD